MKKNSILASLALLSAVIGNAIPNASATVVISDDFTTGGPGRAVGDPLGGTTTPVGAATWITGTTTTPTAGAAFTAANEVNNGGTYSTLASVSLAGAGSLTGKTVTVQADVNFSGNNWGTIEFANVVGPTHDVFASSLLLYVEQKTGNWSIYNNNFGATIASGKVTMLAGLNNLQLIYNAQLNKASAWINGVNVAPFFSLAYTPVLNYAGFGTYGTTGITDLTLTRVDNFVVDVVPEPSSIAMLGLGAMVLLYRRRRK